MRVIALYSIKGGVGKTAACVNLAYLSSREGGARTILCDLDPQGSATYYFRIRPARKFGPKKLLRGGGKMTTKIRGTDFENLDLLPSSLSHRNLDIVLDALKRSKSRLRKALGSLADDYDRVFLDCPPNIGLFAENVFRAADYILVPVVPTTLSLVSYAKLLKFFRDRKLETSRIRAFFSMIERRKRMHRDAMKELVDQNGRFFRTAIPFLADVERMGVRREPVVYGKPRSTAAHSYCELWGEMTDAIDNQRW